MTALAFTLLRWALVLFFSAVAAFLGFMAVLMLNGNAELSLFFCAPLCYVAGALAWGFARE